MTVHSSVYSVTPSQLEKLRDDNELFGALFGEDEDADPSFKVPSLDFFDFEDTHRLLSYVGCPTMHEVLDFAQGNEEGCEYDGWDIRVATPALVKQIAKELEGLTLEEVREKGLAAEFRTDRGSRLLKPDEYELQFREIAETRDFFAAAAKAGNAAVAAAS